jgi:hypothetical protein
MDRPIARPDDTAEARPSGTLAFPWVRNFVSWRNTIKADLIVFSNARSSRGMLAGSGANWVYSKSGTAKFGGQLENLPYGRLRWNEGL